MFRKEIVKMLLLSATDIIQDLISIRQFLNSRLIESKQTCRLRAQEWIILAHCIVKVCMRIVICLNASLFGIILDLVADGYSKTFINSLRNFIARRGCPELIISDNGKVFVADETQNLLLVVQ